MADDIFKVDFYVNRWLLKTSPLPPDIRGNYIQICCLIYANNGPIENDAKWIAGLCGCSSRLVRSHVDYLVDKNFLTINSAGKITQNKAEKELNVKRTVIENASNAGRTSAEQRRKFKENNDIGSTAVPEAVQLPPHPTPPHPHKPNNKHPSSNPRDDGGGVFKNFGEGFGVFCIEHHLTDDDRQAARMAAPGWDLHNLMRIYDEGVNSKRRDKPKHPARAFIAWLPMYTKGKKP